MSAERFVAGLAGHAGTSGISRMPGQAVCYFRATVAAPSVELAAANLDLPNVAAACDPAP